MGEKALPLARLRGRGGGGRAGGGDAALLRLRGDPLLRRALRSRRVQLAAGAGRGRRLRVAALLLLVRLDRLGGRLQLAEVALRNRVEVRDAAEASVRVLVAVDVLQHDVAADLLRHADLPDDPV